MDKIRKYAILITLFAGLSAMGLRFALYRFGTDSRGLLISFHWTEILLWILTAAFLCCILILVRRMKPSDGCTTSKLPALVNWLLAAAIVLMQGSGASVGFSGLFRLHRVMTYLASAALIYNGYSLYSRKKDAWWCTALVSLFFATCMVVNYQNWSRNPQMMDYVFSLLACAAMGIFAYQLTAFQVGIPAPKKLTAFGLLGAYLCFAAIPMESYATVYFVCVIWALTTVLTHPTKQKEEN